MMDSSKKKNNVTHAVMTEAPCSLTELKYHYPTQL